MTSVLKDTIQIYSEKDCAGTMLRGERAADKGRM